MKKQAALIITAVMLAGTGCHTISAGTETNINISVEGTAVELNKNPIIADNIVIVPAKAVFEKLGYNVNWESTSKTMYATRNKKTVVLKADGDNIILNDESIKAEHKISNIDGTIYMSLTDIAKVTDSKTVWSDDKRSVNITDGEEKTDDKWKENNVSVDMSDVKESIYKITEGGVYTLTGNYEGMISVDTEDSVKLLLNGVNITDSTGPAVYAENCNKLIIETATGSENTLTDGKEYSSDAKGCVFANDDIELQGSGILNVNGNYDHGIVSDDGIKIEGGTVNINAAGDGMHANDGITLKDGNVNISSVHDGLQAEMYVNIEGGSLNVTASGEAAENIDNKPTARGGMPFAGGERPTMPGGQTPNGDGQSSQTARPDRKQMLEDGKMPENFKERRTMENMAAVKDAAEGSTETTTEYPSSKGIKADTNITVTGGNISISSNDHCIKSAGITAIEGGNIKLDSAVSKGIKAEGDLFINGGDITANTKDEGIESKATATINGGNISIISDDDGINAGGGTGFGRMDNASDGDEHQVVINNGSIYINAKGDGIDSNGNLYINGGTITVDGPSDNGNGAFDFAAKSSINGGSIIALGSSGMAACPDAGTQNVFSVTLDEIQKAETSVAITDSKGKTIGETVSAKEFQNIVFSSPEITEGESYTIYVGGVSAAVVTAEKGVSYYGNRGREFGGGRRAFGEQMTDRSILPQTK